MRDSRARLHRVELATQAFNAWCADDPDAVMAAAEYCREKFGADNSKWDDTAWLTTIHVIETRIRLKPN